ncbi:MAG TPA: hypothetical protein VFP54_11765 [Acidimicrobiales bacterium]|nr:hypothetical protein [Acidimicrobiales bacterium]
MACDGCGAVVDPCWWWCPECGVPELGRAGHQSTELTWLADARLGPPAD